MLQGPAHRNKVAEQQKIPDQSPCCYSPASTHKKFGATRPVGNQMLWNSSSSFMVLAEFTVVNATLMTIFQVPATSPKPSRLDPYCKV
jgi:hypothetical protein